MRLALPLTFLILIASACSTARVNPWSLQTTPSPGTPQAIGKTGAGCLAGGLPLPADGPGYAVMRPSRHRFYGHPVLLSFIQDLGRRAREKNLGPILIGDLAQPRGGPMPGGHASHQTGTDVDVWYLQPEITARTAPTADERETRSAVSVAAPGLWNPAQTALLRLAAQDPRVERIFVNPAIKKTLCTTEKEKAWLRKIRPWWGHDDHFHVRLNCPADSPHCVNAAPPPRSEECDATLEWWFTDEARKQGEAPGERKEPVLPVECRAVIEEPGR